MRTVAVSKNVGISSASIREGILLDGTYDSSNRIFALPEKVVNDPPRTIVKMYHNGRRMLPEEYEVYENVPGSGYDMVRISFAPQATSRLMVDYMAA
jgi:hypothetical protein